MDGGDILFIIIVTILGIISSVSRKKKEAAKRAMKQTEAEKPESYSEGPSAENFENQTEGRYTWPQQPVSEAQASDTMRDFTSSNPRNEGKSVFPGMDNMEGEVKSVEYEMPSVQVSEEELYAPKKYEVLDKIPAPSVSSVIDQPVSPYETTFEGMGPGYQPIVFEEPEQEEESKAPDMIFEYEKVLEQESNQAGVLDDFNPAKAVIYSEIINKKYF
jgi:hypothetical protein